MRKLIEKPMSLKCVLSIMGLDFGQWLLVNEKVILIIGLDENQ